MLLTQDAINYFKNKLKEENKSIVNIVVMTSCCSIGENIHISFEDELDNYIIINDIKFILESDDKSYFDNLKIDYKNNSIIYDSI